MKFVLAFVALASVAAVNAAPGTFFGEDETLKGLETVQINLKKIKLAGEDIDVTEGLLKTLNDNAATIESAMTVVTTAADKAPYENESFTHESTS